MGQQLVLTHANKRKSTQMTRAAETDEEQTFLDWANKAHPAMAMHLNKKSVDQALRDLYEEERTSVSEFKEAARKLGTLSRCKEILAEVEFVQAETEPLAIAAKPSASRSIEDLAKHALQYIRSNPGSSAVDIKNALGGVDKPTWLKLMPTLKTSVRTEGVKAATRYYKA